MGALAGNKLHTPTSVGSVKIAAIAIRIACASPHGLFVSHLREGALVECVEHKGAAAKRAVHHSDLGAALKALVRDEEGRSKGRGRGNSRGVPIGSAE